jgi:hypothetical protein
MIAVPAVIRFAVCILNFMLMFYVGVVFVSVLSNSIFYIILIFFFDGLPS